MCLLFKITFFYKKLNRSITCWHVINMYHFVISSANIIYIYIFIIYLYIYIYYMIY